MEKKEVQSVNVDKVLRNKTGKAYRLIPKALIRYLERIVHQDEINEALLQMQGISGLDFIESALTDKFGIDIEVINPENIPVKGRYIIASNHPLGGLDGMALMHVVGKKRKDIKFISNDILLELHNMRELFIAVNKHGRSNTEMVRDFEACMASDMLIMVFPAGLVSRRIRGRIADLEWKKTFITKAIQHKRDIIPVYIEGRNSNFFYNLANWRKRLRIGLNIEMLYLPDEMFRQKNKKLRILFGRPVPWETFTTDYKPIEWAQLMKEHVYALPGGGIAFKLNQKNE